MSHWNDQLNVACTLTAHFLLCHLNTTTVTHDALVTNALVFAAVTLVILCRTKNALAEQAVTLWLICTVVDGFRLKHLTIRICHDLLRRSQTNGNLRKVALYLIISFECHFCRND